MTQIEEERVKQEIESEGGPGRFHISCRVGT